MNEIKLVVKPVVKIGQILADNDLRAKGRTIEVRSVDADHAICEVLTNRTAVSPVSPVPRQVTSSVGRWVKIKISRFRPTKSGYVLLSEAPMPVIFTLPAEPGTRVDVAIKYEGQNNEGDTPSPDGNEASGTGVQAAGSGC